MSINNYPELPVIIRLESVGTAFNQETGECCPLNADGSHDFDAGETTHVMDTEAPEWFEALDLGDKAIVDNYLEAFRGVNCNELHKALI